MLLEEFPFEPGFRLTDGDLLNKVAAEPAYSVDNTVTATGANQNTAYNIRATVTVVTAGVDQAGIRLPFPKVGRLIFILNYTATGKRIYPFDGELINGATTADLPFDMGMMLVCTSSTTWAASQVETNTTGDIVLVASDADTATGAGHFVDIEGGAGGTTSGNGGNVTVKSGPATGSPGDAGDVFITGATSTQGKGGDIVIAGGTGVTRGTVTIVDTVVIGSVVAGTSTEIVSPTTKIDGATTLSGAGTALTVTNNATIGGTLGVTGATTLSGGGTLTGTFAGSPTFSGATIAVTNNETVGGTLVVTGATTLNGGGTLTGTFAGSPTLSGATITITNALTVNGAAQFNGTTTNDSAAAGRIGEVITANVASPGVTLTSPTASNVTQVSLTAGDWDVAGEVWLVAGTGGATVLQAGINTVTGTLPATQAVGTAKAVLNATVTVSTTSVVPLARCRVSLASTTIVYLVAAATFPSGTTTAFGIITARRAR